MALVQEQEHVCIEAPIDDILLCCLKQVPQAYDCPINKSLTKQDVDTFFQHVKPDYLKVGWQDSYFRNPNNFLFLF
jgi:hypothetical protein